MYSQRSYLLESLDVLLLGRVDYTQAGVLCVETEEATEERKCLLELDLLPFMK